MCLSAPNPPPPPPAPEIQRPAELEAGRGIKRKQDVRSQMLIKKRRSMTGAAPTSTSV